MRQSIRHLRGTPLEYQNHDLTVPDGELALSRRAGGGFRIKIGNGGDPYSALPYFGRSVVEGDYDTVVLSHGRDLRLGTRRLIEIVLPSEYEEDFFSLVSFDSPEVPTAFYSTEGDIIYMGDGCADGCFIPSSGLHYTLLFFYDGRMRALCRSSVSTAKPPKKIQTKNAEGAIACYPEGKESLLELTVHKADASVASEVGTDTGDGSYEIPLRIANAALMDFATFGTRFKSAVNRKKTVTYTLADTYLKFSNTTTSAITVLSNKNTAFAQGVRYRLRVPMVLNIDAPAVGETIASGFSILYTDGTSESITTVCDGGNSYVLNFVSAKDKTVSQLNLEAPADGIERTLYSVNFYFGVYDVPETVPMENTCSILIGAPLAALGDKYDELSVIGGYVTRWIKAEQNTDLTTITLDNADGTYAVFVYEVSDECASSQPVSIADFEECAYSDLPQTKYAYCMQNNRLYFTLSSSVKEVADIEDITYELPIVRYIGASSTKEQITVGDYELYPGYSAFNIDSGALPLFALTVYE